MQNLFWIEVMPQGPPDHPPLYPGEPVTFLWSIRGEGDGHLSGRHRPVSLDAPQNGGDTHGTCGKG